MLFQCKNSVFLHALFIKKHRFKPICVRIGDLVSFLPYSELLCFIYHDFGQGFYIVEI